MKHIPNVKYISFSEIYYSRLQLRIGVCAL